ncbi:MAG: methyltransferase domain-containing protein [Rhodospirillales bacterium]|nr:methyltransferase domain-containing protein [Rhodospirillales bacterium]
MTSAEEGATPRRRHWWQADQYGRNALLVADLAADLIDVLDLRPRQRVLDVGCGDGAFSSRIGARGTEVFGIDPLLTWHAAPDPEVSGPHVCAAQNFAEKGTFDLAIGNAAFH